MSEKYSDRVVDAYRRSRSKFPIDTWVKVIGSKLPEFRGNNSIYAPVTLYVKLAENAGSTKIKVASTDQNWYSTLKQAIGDMVNRSPASIDIVDYVGDRIDQRKSETLHHVGELDVIDTNTRRPIRLPKPVAPPAYLSTNKLAVLRDWSETIREPLIQLVASNLIGRSIPEIGQITLKDGPLQRSINKFISESATPEFLDTYSVDEVSRGTSPAQKTETMARSILYQVRGALVANKTRIEEFHAQEQGRKLGDEPIFAGKSTDQNDLVMYQEIAADAISSELLSKKLIHTIYNGNRSVARPKMMKPAPQGLVSSSIRHPRDQYYDEYHFAKFGKYPGHAMDRFNKTRVEGSADTPYRGNPATVASMFKLFTGQFLTPIECNTCGGKKKNKKKISPIACGTNDDDEDEDEMIRSQLPPLVPIAGHMKKKIMPVESQLPPLVPIAGHMKHKNKKKKKKMPVESMLPPLVPIAGKTKDLIACGTNEDEDEDEVIRSQLPPLVPIAGHMKHKGKWTKEEEEEDMQAEIDNERLEGSVFSTPSFTSFLQKKYSSK